MNELDCLKSHHVEFRVMIDDIRQLLADEDVVAVANEVMSLISRLNGQLMVHLTMEDRHVYPALLASENSNIQNLANQFKGEIGGLFLAFQDYRLKWSCAQQIVEDPTEFLIDTEAIFSILNKRMALEDESLYPEVMSLQMS